MKKHYILFVITIVMIFVGCDKEAHIIPPPPEEMLGPPIVRDMPIFEVEIDTATNEANVTIIGWLPDACSDHHKTTVSREGYTIRIKITITGSRGPCMTEAFDYRETIALGSLDVGDYTVIVNDTETSFTIEP